jgi:acetyltransferase-like isoleucine patch superfamily enzyme
MSFFSKIGKGLRFYTATAMAKIRYGSKLKVNGLFRGRHDTQITLEDGGSMAIGEGVSFYRNVSLSSIGGDLQIGNRVSFNRNCIIICHKKITIGDHVMFGPNVTIYDHDHIFSDEGILPGFKYGPVVIENGCWIAANVTILRNTHIGEGCVIGAGTVVKGDIPPHSLVTGNRELNIVPIVKKPE